MTNFVLSIEDNPDPRDIQSVIGKIFAYNKNVQQHEYIASPVSVLIRDAQNHVVGGLVGETYWGWLFIAWLWVDETLRGQGYGRELLLKAEQVAKGRGCNYAYLDTFSFQALGFYQRLGYQIFGVLENFPPQHQRYFLQKQI